MLTLYADIISKIGEHLTDQEKIYITATSKTMDKFKHTMLYDKKMHINMIKDLSYFDNFLNIEISDTIGRCPKYSKNINFNARSTNLLSRNPFLCNIKITHLDFDRRFNQSISNCIPLSVTHIRFGNDYNKPLLKSIPPAVTHLTFGDNFNQSIKDCLPASITHLTFGHKFNQSITNCLPLSITHLTFGYFFNQPIKKTLPSSITHLIFGGRFNQKIKKYIPPSVTHIQFGFSFDYPINNMPLSINEIIIDNRYCKEISTDLALKIKYI